MHSWWLPANVAQAHAHWRASTLQERALPVRRQSSSERSTHVRQEDCQARYARGDSEHALWQARACLACQQGGRAVPELPGAPVRGQHRQQPKARHPAARSQCSQLFGARACPRLATAPRAPAAPCRRACSRPCCSRRTPPGPPPRPNTRRQALFPGTFQLVVALCVDAASLTTDARRSIKVAHLLLLLIPGLQLLRRELGAAAQVGVAPPVGYADHRPSAVLVAGAGRHAPEIVDPRVNARARNFTAVAPVSVAPPLWRLLRGLDGGHRKRSRHFIRVATLAQLGWARRRVLAGADAIEVWHGCRHADATAPAAGVLAHAAGVRHRDDHRDDVHASLSLTPLDLSLTAIRRRRGLLPAPEVWHGCRDADAVAHTAWVGGVHTRCHASGYAGVLAAGGRDNGRIRAVSARHQLLGRQPERNRTEKHHGASSASRKIGFAFLVI
eukprot:scaffold66426_cov71-Phaeocystis_antarctica.AAC.1